METSTDSLLAMRVLQMSDQACFVLLSLSASRTNAMDTFHVLDELVRHLEDLLAVIAGQELAAGLVLARVDAEVELLAEGHLAFLALETVFSGTQVFIPCVFFDEGEVVGGVVTLVAVIPVSDVIIVYERQHFVGGCVGCFSSNG